MSGFGALLVRSGRVAAAVIMACSLSRPEALAIDANIPSKESSPAVDTMNKIIVAYGGQSGLRRYFQSAKLFRGFITAKTRPRYMQYEIGAFASQYYYKFSGEGWYQQTTYDGTKAWIDDSGLCYPLSQSEVARMTEPGSTLFKVLRSVEPRCCDIEIMPDRRVAGEHCDVIRISGRKGAPVILSARKRDHLILELTLADAPKKSARSIFQFSHYENVSGFPMPMCCKYLINNVASETHWSTVSISDTLSEAEHQKLVAPCKKVASITKLPFEIEYGRIVMRGAINGQKAKLILDTGSNTTVVNGLFAEAANVVALQGTDAPSQAAFSRSILSRGNLKSLCLGEHEFKDFPVSIDQSVKPRFAARLGMDFLRQFRSVTINFLDHTICFTSSAGTSPPNGVRAISIKVQELPFIEVSINGGPKHPFLIDTGSTGVATIMEPEGFPREYAVTGASTIRDVNSAATAVQLVRLGALTIGDVIELKNPEVRLVQLKSHRSTRKNILGLEAFAQMAIVVFEFSDERMYFLEK